MYTHDVLIRGLLAASESTCISRFAFLVVRLWIDDKSDYDLHKPYQRNRLRDTNRQ